MVKDRINGLTYRSIGEKYGVSYTVAYTYISPHIKKRKKIYNKRNEEVKADFKRNMSSEDLCKKYNITRRQVYNILRELGLKKPGKAAQVVLKNTSLKSIVKKKPIEVIDQKGMNKGEVKLRKGAKVFKKLERTKTTIVQYTY